MKQKTFLNAVGIIFGIIAALHLSRAILSWPAQIGIWNIPLWVSWITVIVAGFLSYVSFKLNKQILNIGNSA